MKSSFICLLLAFLCLYGFAQAPEGFNYQGIARDNKGKELVNQNIQLRISILLNSSTGTSVYTESFSLTTNGFGLFNVKVGTGIVSSGNFSKINWTNAIYFLKVEMDPAGGTNYLFIGSSQLISVPYALMTNVALKSLNDLDTSALNELQILKLSNDTLYLDKGGFVYLGGYDDKNAIQTIKTKLNADSTHFETQINDERTERQNNDNSLNLKIISDSIYLKELINTNSIDISKETNSRISDDQILKTKQVADSIYLRTMLNTTYANLATETSSRISGDQSLKSKQLSDSTYLKVLITSETTNRINSDNTMQNNINNLQAKEATDSSMFAGYLTTTMTNLTTETNSRIAGDISLKSKQVSDSFYLEGLINTKQSTLSAGTGITLSSNTVSHIAHTGDAIGATSLTVVALQGRNVSTGAPANNEILKWNGSNWAPDADNNTLYDAGTGLIINGSTFSANNTSSIWNANQIQGQLVSATPPTLNELLKWDGSSWTPAADNNTLYAAGTGLLLSGTTFFANAVVAIWNAAKIQGRDISVISPNANEILKWDGTLWSPAAEIAYTAGTGITLSGTTFFADNTSPIWNAGKIMGNDISTVAPSTNQILKWNGSEWTPVADNNDIYSAGAGITIDSSNIIGAIDTSTTNELQAISISNDTIFLANGGYVKLPAGFDGQYSSLTNKPNIADSISDYSVLLTGNQTISGNKTFIDTISANNNNIINVADPINEQDVATKAYVDELKKQIKILEDNLIASGTYQLSDIDSNKYNVVKIGNQVWMKENLKTTHYRDGSTIPNVTDSATWRGLASGAYCNYNNDTANATTYGHLYNWYTVNDSLKICPTGWHVPTHAEWTTLETYLGGDSVAGGKLKEAGYSHWLSPNTGATNSSGFTALPGGTRQSDGRFNYILFGGHWWSSTESNAINAWSRFMDYNYSILANGIMFKETGYSVRCLRD